MGGFRTRFTESLMPMVAEQRLHKMAVRRSYRNGTEVDEELDKLRAEYNDCGDLPVLIRPGYWPCNQTTASQNDAAGAG